MKISQISKRLNNPKGVYCSRQCWGDQRAFLTPKAQYPSRANKKAHLARVRGKACLICGFDRIIDWCHIIPRKIGGTAHYINMIPLCPNHHRLFDRHTLTEGEWDKISDALLDSWGDPLAAHLPGDDYLFSEEGQRQLNAIPLESLLNLPDGATWDSLIERPFPTSLQESSPLQAHEGNDEEPQGA